MSQSQQELRHLLNRARTGSPQAISELIEQYGPHVLRVVRRRLNRRLRSKFDSDDFVQTVWASFFANSEKLGDFEEPNELIAHLATMARNKVIQEFRHRFQTQKRNLRRERFLESSTLNRSAALADKQPTPSENVAADERWQSLIRGLPAHYQQILWLRSQQFTFREIASRVGLHERTVRRVVNTMNPG